MADDDKEKDPDYVPEFSTIAMEDLQEENVQNEEEFEADEVPRDRDASAEEDGQEKYFIKPTPSTIYRPRPKKDRRTSLIWTKFTIIDKKNQIASCNICEQRMSIKSTSGNLKKHLERKHGFSIQLGVLPHKRNQQKIVTPSPRPKVSELSGISDKGITVKVVGEDGEEEHYQVLGEDYMSEEVVQGDGQDHVYSSTEHHEEEGDRDPEPLRIGKVRSLNEARSSKRGVMVQSRPYAHMDDKAKQRRITELQIECLENKKYNMRLEALQMEQQLNLPRSIYTEPLNYADVSTRSTQTDVGGGDTRVFYVADRRGARPLRQLFTLQEFDDF